MRRNATPLHKLLRNFASAVSLMVGERKLRSPDLAEGLQPYTAILSSSSRHIGSLWSTVTSAESQTRALAYLKPHSTPPNRGLCDVFEKTAMRNWPATCVDRGPNIISHSETHPASTKRASGSLSGWLLWGRRCIFKCSRRKPPTQRHSSPPDSQSSLRHGCAQRVSAKLFTADRQLVVSRYLNGIPDKDSPFSR